jgi:hypothetical protein
MLWFAIFEFVQQALPIAHVSSQLRPSAIEIEGISMSPIGMCGILEQTKMSCSLGMRELDSCMNVLFTVLGRVQSPIASGISLQFSILTSRRLRDTQALHEHSMYL